MLLGKVSGGVLDGSPWSLKSGGAGTVDDGVVEYCVFEYTVTGPADGYTNGVDVHAGKNWIIRFNLFRNITSPVNAYLGPAILMWRGAENTTCEANTFSTLR